MPVIQSMQGAQLAQFGRYSECGRRRSLVPGETRTLEYLLLRKAAIPIRAWWRLDSLTECRSVAHQTSETTSQVPTSGALGSPRFNFQIARRT
jgi:hypothetical protein